MLSLWRAEWIKVKTNRLYTLFTLGIFPVGAVLLFGLFVLSAVISRNLTTANMNFPIDQFQWSEQITFGLTLTGNFFAQIFLIAFCASVFANESAQNMWKNIIPRNSRLSFLLVKFAMCVVMVLITVLITSLISAIGSMSVQVGYGTPITPELNAENINATLRSFGIGFIATIFTTFILTCYAMLASLIARSTFAGIAVGIGAMIVDQVLPVAFALLSRVFNIQDLVLLHHFTPAYNTNNVTTWLLSGEGFTQWSEWTPNAIANTLPGSLAVLLVWFVVLFALSAYVFNRRDVA
jgi:ABC-type transport system involved in multi-copper enzyme maturation permease subunit